MVVKFSDPAEFLEELQKDKGTVERGIVRLSYLFRPSKISPNIRHLSLVATARVAGQLLRLDHYCGDLWGIERADQEVTERAERLKKTIEVGCRELKLDVRSGVFEVME